MCAQTLKLPPFYLRLVSSGYVIKPHWLFSVSEPLNLTVTDVNEHDLTVSWRAPVVDFTRFEVRCEADGDYSDYSGYLNKSDELYVYSFTCIELTSGANYTVEVETFNDGAAVSEPSTVNSTTSKIWRNMFSQVDYIIFAQK